MKPPYFMCLLDGVGEHNTKIPFVFFLSQLWSFGVQPQKMLPTFDKLNKIL